MSATDVGWYPSVANALGREGDELGAAFLATGGEASGRHRSNASGVLDRAVKKRRPPRSTCRFTSRRHDGPIGVGPPVGSSPCRFTSSASGCPTVRAHWAPLRPDRRGAGRRHRHRHHRAGRRPRRRRVGRRPARRTAGRPARGRDRRGRRRRRRGRPALDGPPDDPAVAALEVALEFDPRAVAEVGRVRVAGRRRPTTCSHADWVGRGRSWAAAGRGVRRSRTADRGLAVCLRARRHRRGRDRRPRRAGRRPDPRRQAWRWWCHAATFRSEVGSGHPRAVSPPSL